jgi:hypothetical protein
MKTPRTREKRADGGRRDSRERHRPRHFMIAKTLQSGQTVKSSRSCKRPWETRPVPAAPSGNGQFQDPGTRMRLSAEQAGWLRVIGLLTGASWRQRCSIDPRPEEPRALLWPAGNTGTSGTTGTTGLRVRMLTAEEPHPAHMSDGYMSRLYVLHFFTCST